MDALVRWWMYTLPPVDGRLRFVVYALLFVLSWTHEAGLLAGPDLVFRTPAFAYTPRGLAGLVLTGQPSADWVLPLRAVTAIAWVAAAIGLFSRPAAVITAIGAFTLHGVTAGVVGQNHGWYLPTFTLIALTCARTDDRFSVDFHIRRWRGLPERPAHAKDHDKDTFELGRTGFARVLVLVVAMGLLFMGGVAKLWGSGLEWLDGHTLRVYIEAEQTPPLSTFLKQHLWACAALSWATLSLELGALLALLSRGARHVIVAAAACFHVGVQLVMVPAYAQYLVCYALLIDWGAIAAWASARLGRPRAPTRPVAMTPSSPVARVSTAGGMLLVASLALVTLLRIEWWPVTHVPMYSTYLSKQRVGEIRKADLFDIDKAAVIARDCLASRPCAWALPIRVARHIRVRVLTYGSSEELGADVPSSQWKYLVSGVAMRQLSASANAGVDAQAPGGPVEEFLRTLVPEVRARAPAGTRGRIVFEYKVRGGYYRLGQVRFSSPEAPAPE
ncbi:HTTM domain-containing protein [Enhygromyxa salina]|uniref:HTTM domain-containing protein n=1 Tax=Enhygromyxa salina TaxID=215803 RepID=A0A2S9YJE6_9BACT|nr:hypothetical protein [Enhygromyxa salina]PRQ05156.1 hypothetical protein ENSA7_47850 [Enhygromyxa salina]